MKVNRRVGNQTGEQETSILRRSETDTFSHKKIKMKPNNFSNQVSSQIVKNIFNNPVIHFPKGINFLRSSLL